MKPHPSPHRIRKTIKWGGAAVTVPLVGVWVASVWCGATCETDDQKGRVSGCAVAHGTLHAGLIAKYDGFQPQPAGWHWSVSSIPPGMSWWAVHVRTGPDWFAELPLWIPVSLCLPPAAAAWYLDTLARRRVRLNLCPKCNYDRAGLAAGTVCPECGKAAFTAPSAAS